MKRIWLSCTCIALLLLPLAAAAADPPAPGWELNDLQGQPHRLEDWRGQWVLLKLGTTICPNCAQELEEMDKVKDRLDALGVNVLDIYLHQDRYTVKKYWAKKNLAFRPVVLYDYLGKLITEYKLSIIPVLCLVNPEGQLVWRGQFTPAEELVTILESHVGAGGEKTASH